MERAELEVYLQEGLSLGQIGRRVGLHPSTVSYWLRKHGLAPVNRDRCSPKGGLTREQLAPLVEEGLSVREIARRVGLAYSTVRHWLRAHGLETDGARRLRTPRSERPDLVQRACRHHGLTTFVLTKAKHYRCRACAREAVIRRRRQLKLILIEEAGGRCQLCGFDAFAAAMQFHHLDPESKSFHISQGGRTLSLARLRAEAQKCTLLCANCHAGVEAGVIQLPRALLDCSA